MSSPLRCAAAERRGLTTSVDCPAFWRSALVSWTTRPTVIVDNSAVLGVTANAKRATTLTVTKSADTNASERCRNARGRKSLVGKGRRQVQTPLTQRVAILIVG